MKNFNGLTQWNENSEILIINVVVHIISTVLQMFDVHSPMNGTKSG